LALSYLRHWLNGSGIKFEFEIGSDDFILANTSRLRPAPSLDMPTAEVSPPLIISNPPYLKVPKADPRVAALAEVVHVDLRFPPALLSPFGQMR
jgi:hypothetical protein